MNNNFVSVDIRDILIIHKMNRWELFKISKVKANLNKIKLSNDGNYYFHEKIVTEHYLHCGIYIRKTDVLKNNLMLGSIILKPSILIVTGNVSLIYDDREEEIIGQKIIPCFSPRQNLFLAKEDSSLISIFRSNENDIKIIEDQVYENSSELISRKTESMNFVFNSNISYLNSSME